MLLATSLLASNHGCVCCGGSTCSVANWLLKSRGQHAGHQVPGQRVQPALLEPTQTHCLPCCACCAAEQYDYVFEDQIEFIVDQYLAGDRVVSYCCWLGADHLHDRQPIPLKGAL